MGTRAFMMSASKRRELKQEEERRIREERKRIEALTGRPWNQKPPRRKRTKMKPSSVPFEPTQYPSVMTMKGMSNVTAKKEANVYTGSNLIGIATMHKSNMVPVFKKEDALEIATMRRN